MGPLCPSPVRDKCVYYKSTNQSSSLAYVSPSQQTTQLTQNQCCLIPEVLDLPNCTYPFANSPKPQLTPPDADVHIPYHPDSKDPCPVCHLIPYDQWCKNCPRTEPLHPRHDHPPKLVGNQDGICPLCSVREVKPGVATPWKDCACGMSLSEVDRRQVGGSGSGGLDGMEVVQVKEEPRGRQL